MYHSKRIESMLTVSDLFPTRSELVDIATRMDVVRVRNGEARIVRQTADCSGGLRILCRGYFEAREVLVREEAKLQRAQAKMAKLRGQIQRALARQQRTNDAKLIGRRQPCIGGGRILTDANGVIIGAQACHCEACKAHRTNMVERLGRKYAKSPSFQYSPEVSLKFPAAPVDNKPVDTAPKFAFSVIGKGRETAQALIAKGVNPLLAYLG